MSKNLLWINSVKAICMLTVYLQHSISLYGIRMDWWEPQYITSFYVNGFFFVSGYLFFWKNLRKVTSEPYWGGVKC